MANNLVPKLDLTKFNNKKTLSKKTYDPVKQIESYKKRIAGSGLDVNKEVDSRNFIERTLNLTPDQNALFDIFELLERPQQALFNAWDAKQKGKNVKEALKTGISGNDVVRFKEILHNYGVVDSGKKVGVDDVAGFLGDIFVDPLNVPMMPAKASSSTISKLTKGVEDATKNIDTLKKVGKVVKNTEEVTRATEILKKTEKALANANKTRLITPIDGIFRIVKKGGKATFKLTDNTITRILEKLDKAGLKSSEMSKSLELADSYKDIKKQLQQIFNAAKKVPAHVMDKFRKNLGDEVWNKNSLGIMYEDWYKNDFKEMAMKKGFTEKEYSELLYDLTEYSKYNPDITLRELFLNKNIERVPVNEEVKNLINKFLNTYFPRDFKTNKLDDLWEIITLDNGVKSFRFKSDRLDFINSSIKDLIENGIPAKKIEIPGLVAKGAEIPETVKILNPIQDTIDAKIKAPRFYSDEQIKKFNKLLQDKDMVDAIDRVEKLMKKMTEFVDESANTLLAKGLPKGYLKHNVTKEREKLLNKYKLDFDKFETSQLKGNVNEFTGRKYKMSKLEANLIYKSKIKKALESDILTKAQKEFWESKKGMDLFETSINSSIADFIESTPKFAKDIKQLDDVLVSSIFLDKDIIRPIKVDEKVKIGYTQINKSDLVNKLKKFKKYVPEETAKKFDLAIKGLPKESKLAMDKTVFEMIGRLGNQKELSKLVKFIDMTNNAFKKFKLLSPGFQMRNILGNTTNMYLSGIPMDDIVKEINKADKIFKKAPDIVKKATLNGVDSLDNIEREIYNSYKRFVSEGFHDISKEVWDVEKIISEKKLANTKEKKNSIKWAADKNFAANQKWDERFRMASLNYASEHPEVYAKLGLDSPSAFVRHSLFDPKDLSKTERETLRRLVPFYTFTKKNLAFQMKNLFDNPRKYNYLRKTIRETWDVFANIDDKDIERYKMENFWIPVPFINKDGKYAAIKTNLPVGDLGELMQNPTRKVLASTAPLIRAPFETLTNRQIYTDMPIQEFKGQKGYIFPNLSRKQEYYASQVGLDVPGALLADVGRTGLQAVKGELQPKSSFDLINQTVGRSVFSTGSVEQAQRSKAYQELKQIQDLMKYYKQENIDILTLAEIENKNDAINSLSTRLRALLR